jgi:hypothetical protein
LMVLCLDGGRGGSTPSEAGTTAVRFLGVLL